MKRQLVFIPVGPDELGVMSGDPAIVQRTAYTVTDELVAELGYEAKDAEDAEYAALVLASVAALCSYGARTVVVAEVDPALVSGGVDPVNGQIVLASCPVGAITSWFAEEPGADVADAAAISRGLTIDQAWYQPAVQALLNSHDLLWNDVVEYRRGEEG